ncbi:hypothetical protein AAVH_11202 [Aphelenchoides avenae]|nr:hypothetical protein AAVH_11202 [Aphelenchus avenae]
MKRCYKVVRIELIAGNEDVKSLQETTWIGLQVGTPPFGCYWPVGVHPRLVKDDTCPEKAVDECIVAYNDTFHGQWEDGKLYSETESADFWGPDEPSTFEKLDCNGQNTKADDQSRAYCQLGINGQPDRRRHCAQILPVDEKQIDDGMPRIRSKPLFSSFKLALKQFDLSLISDFDFEC